MLPNDDDLIDATAPAEPTLPPGTPCLYVLSAGDAWETFQLANAAARDAGQPAAVLDLLTVEAVRTDLDEATGRATVTAVVAGELAVFAARQHDPTGRTPGTWREA